MEKTFFDLRMLMEAGEKRACTALPNEHRAVNSLTFAVRKADGELLSALNRAIKEGKAAPSAQCAGELRIVCGGLELFDTEKGENLFLKAAQYAADQLGKKLISVPAGPGSDLDLLEAGEVDIIPWICGENYRSSELVRTRTVPETISITEPLHKETWYAGGHGSALSRNGMWSEILADPEERRLINAGVDNYVIVRGDTLHRYSLSGELIEALMIRDTQQGLAMADGLGNENVYTVEDAEGLGVYRFDCVEGRNRGFVASVRPWVDHMYHVTGTDAGGNEFIPMFAGFSNGLCVWRHEDEIASVIGSFEFDPQRLSVTFVHGPASEETVCIGAVTLRPDGFLWEMGNGTSLTFIRLFDGVWRCPGFNTFCLSSMGNVKIFMNYQKKYRTPVAFICDYERAWIIERYMDRRRLNYAVRYFKNSQVMDGQDGVDLGRRFQNLYYFDGIWRYQRDGREYELEIDGSRCVERCGNIAVEGHVFYDAGVQVRTFGCRRERYCVDFTGVNTFTVRPVSDPELCVELRRAQEL